MLDTVSKAGFLMMVAGIVGLAMTHTLFSPNPLVVGAQVAAAALMVWARIAFGRRSFHANATPTAGGLVTSGPYRFIRHPIYTAVCLFTGAGVASHWSWEAGACGVLVIGSLVMRMYCEETLVAKRYPEYRDYAANTWRMIPYVY